MADKIRITCDHCNHIIQAPRSAAGKRGKCPHCHSSVYIPTPPDELEEIPLLPVEEEEEARAEKLKQEDRAVAAALHHETSEPPEIDESAVASVPPAASPPAKPPFNISEAIVDYLVAMQASNLEKADKIVHQLAAHRQQAESRIQQLIVDPIPPALVRDMPSGLYQGFLNKLLEQLKSA